MIVYSTNAMGPVTISWFKERGFTKRVSRVLESDSLLGVLKAGDIIDYDEITQDWTCGRIDIYGTDDPYPREISLPMMLGEDWNRFSIWLSRFKTEDVWNLNQLVEEYEKTNPKITWYKEKMNKVYCIFLIDFPEKELFQIFDSKEKAEKWIDDLPSEQKDDSWNYVVKEWEVE